MRINAGRWSARRGELTQTAFWSSEYCPLLSLIWPSESSFFTFWQEIDQLLIMGFYAQIVKKKSAHPQSSSR